MASRKAESTTGDLRGAARLITDATSGLADLVEAMHARIGRFPGGPGVPAAPSGADSLQPSQRTRGITGLVYQTVRGTTRLVGGSVDGLLSLVDVALSSAARRRTASPAAIPNDKSPAPQMRDMRPHDSRQPERDAVISALNGVLGDYLVATSNPLALGMTLHALGGAPIGRANLAAVTGGSPTGATSPNGIVVLVHGLCMNDLQWQRNGHDHGLALQRDLGLLPVYARYNTGLHVSINGRALSQQLEALLTPSLAWMDGPGRLVIVGHSMGGLVARSALQAADMAGHAWPTRLRDLVFLGTPHHGSAFERAGNWLDAAMGVSSYSAPLARLGKLRSAGITDLRFGNLVDEDWVGRDRFARHGDRRQPLPLPAHVNCYAMAASRSRRRGTNEATKPGDGLVSVDSALGRHADPARTLRFTSRRQWVGEGLNHFDLLGDPAAYRTLRRWLTPPSQSTVAPENLTI